MQKYIDVLCRVCILIACAFLAQALDAQVTFTVSPRADAFVTSGPPGNDRSNNNYGAAGALAIAANGKAQGEFQSLLKFDLSGSAAFFNSTYGAGKWTVHSITLQMTAQSPGNPIFNSSAAGSFNIIWQTNDSWVEGTGTPNVPTVDGVTYASLPSFEGGSDLNVGTFGYNGATSGAFVYTLLLPPGFASDVMAGNIVSLRLAAADSNMAGIFSSVNFGTASARPMLTVTAIPEPGTFALLCLPLALALIAYRKHLPKA